MHSFHFGVLSLQKSPVDKCRGVIRQPGEAAQLRLVVLYPRVFMVPKDGQSLSTTTTCIPTMAKDSDSGVAPTSVVDVTIEAPQEPLCTEQHVLNCQFSQWYPIFKHCTPRSVIIELGEEVVEYLQEDGVLLPQGFEISCGKEMPSDEEVDDWGNGEDQDEENDERPVFPALHDCLSEAIASLGGKVFPKLNWSSPQDAAWVNGGTLKCSLPGDVMCLLKSSTFVSHDLNHAFDACRDATTSRPQTFTVVLRKWCNLHPSMLFRCFVRQRRLVGVCQRDCTSYYEFLEAEAERLSVLLRDFFENEVCKKFPDPDCVADVYVDKKCRVWLLDINPFSTVTDSLLFDWAEDALCAPLPASTAPTDGEALPSGESIRLYFEPSSSAAHTAPLPATETVIKGSTGIAGYTLAAGGGKDFEFRCVPSNLHILPDPMGRYRGPADVAMGTLAGGIDGNAGLDDLIDACRRTADEE